MLYHYVNMCPNSLYISLNFWENLNKVTMAKMDNPLVNMDWLLWISEFITLDYQID
jgi:hypothetical protein